MSRFGGLVLVLALVLATPALASDLPRATNPLQKQSEPRLTHYVRSTPGKPNSVFLSSAARPAHLTHYVRGNGR